MVCTWNGLGRLITKCDDPEPNEDQTGCANCGALITEFGHFVAPSSPVTDFVTEVITEQLRTSEFGNRNEVTLRYGGSIEPRNSVTDVARNSVTANDQQSAAGAASKDVDNERVYE